MKQSILVAVITLASAASAAAQGTAPTYTKDVAPILYKNCTSCHRPGEIAPMSLLTFKDARPWIKSIGTQVAKGAMPPWHADPAYGEFLNDRRLSAAEKDTLLRWVNAGGPEGDPKDLPAPPKYADGWAIGQPDVVFEMQEDYPLPASGTIAYQYFEVPTTLTEDRWVQAVEVRPGNRATVHHVIVYMRPPEAPASAQPAGAPTEPAASAAGDHVRRRDGHSGRSDWRACAARRSEAERRSERSSDAETARSVDRRLRAGERVSHLSARERRRRSSPDRR